MRKKIVAGNWKMNKTFGEAEKLIADIAASLEGMELKDTEVILCPPFVYLEIARPYRKIERVFPPGKHAAQRYFKLELT